MSFLSKPIVILIRAYQATKYFRPGTCRFYPSCSEYAAQAVCGHGARRGLVLAAKRLFKCHPFHEGGVDAVPPNESVGAASSAANAPIVIEEAA